MNYYGSYYKASAKVKAFISFDYDHDVDLKNLLVGQAKNDDSPFEITDMSVKEELTGDWKEKVRTRIKKVDQVVVICGEHTDTANGVAAEGGCGRNSAAPEPEAKHRRPARKAEGRAEQKNCLFLLEEFLVGRAK